jgi:hypothetical protein
MFRPIGAHLQAIKIHKIIITIANQFCVGRLRSKPVEIALYVALHVD